MFRLGSLIIALGALIWFAANLVGDDRKPKVIDGWGTAIDPDGDCTINGDKARLTIEVPGTVHDLHPSRAMNAPRVIHEFDGDFLATVKVTCPLKPGTNVVGKGASAGVYAGFLRD